MLAIVISTAVSAKAEAQETSESASGGASGVVVMAVDRGEKRSYGEKWVDTRFGIVCYTAFPGSTDGGTAISCLPINPAFVKALKTK